MNQTTQFKNDDVVFEQHKQNRTIETDGGKLGNAMGSRNNLGDRLELTNKHASSFDNSIQKASLNEAQGYKQLENSQSYKEINAFIGSGKKSNEVKVIDNHKQNQKHSTKKKKNEMNNEADQEYETEQDIQKPKKGMSTINLIQKQSSKKIVMNDYRDREHQRSRLDQSNGGEAEDSGRGYGSRKTGESKDRKDKQGSPESKGVNIFAPRQELKQEVIPMPLTTPKLQVSRKKIKKKLIATENPIVDM